MNKLSEKNISKQTGLTLVLVTLTMIFLIGFSALAIDVNHALLNKTRLQNIVDTAALSAAVLFDTGKDEETVKKSVYESIASMSASKGNTELTIPDNAITVTLSNDPLDFSGSYNSNLESYVRVSVSNVPLSNFILPFFGLNKSVSASAVAGPSSSITNSCNIVPMVVCADLSNSSGFYGYQENQVYALKLSAKSQSSMGAGNFQLLDFGSGASAIRSAMAGAFSECMDIDDIAQTKPGGNVGPVGQGLNTRFGEYSSNLKEEDYPSDVYIKEPDTLATIDKNGNVTYTDSWGYEEYKISASACVDGLSANDPYCSKGEIGRRVLPVSIANCSGAKGGTTTLPIVSIGCFFLLQKAPTNNSGTQAVFGEFIEDCTVSNGSTGVIPSRQGAYKIQLYRDPISGES